MILISFSVLTFVAVSKTLLTKFVFINVSTPVIFSTLSCILTSLALIPYFLKTKLNRISPENVNEILLASVMITLDLAFTNVSLSLIPVSLQQCIRATAPSVTILLESLFHEKLYHPLLYLIVFSVTIGPVVMEYGKPMNYETQTGIIWMVLAVTTGAFKNVFAHKIISNVKKEMGILSFTFWIEIICSILLLPWAVMSTEVETFIKIDVQTLLMTFVVALYGGVRIISQFVFLKYTSPTSLSLTNIVTQLFTVLIGIILFENNYTIYTIVGVTITLVLSTVYAYIKMKNILDVCGYPKLCKRKQHELVPLKDEDG